MIPKSNSKKVLLPIIGTNFSFNNDPENIESLNILGDDNSKGTLNNTQY